MGFKNKFLEVGSSITPGSINFLFIFAIACHLFDAFVLRFGQPMLSYRIVLWSAMWLIGYLTLKPREYAFDPYTLLNVLLLSGFSFLVPYLKLWIDMALPASFGDFVVIFAPIWIIYILYFLPDAPPWIRGFGNFYLIFWIVLAIIYGFNIGAFQRIEGINAGYINVYQPLTTVGKLMADGYKDGYKNAKLGIGDFWKSFNATKQGYLNYAVGGDIYTGKVDSNAKEKLGVYLQDVKPSQSEFFTEDPVAVWATIVARTFDRPIIINTNCIADKGTKQQRKADKIIPGAAYEVYSVDEEDLDCSFDAKNLAKGTHKISLLVNFSFHTLGYQKVYFVDKSRILALQKENTDILDYYGVKDKKPIAIYTNGPVMIGMDVKNMPIKLDRRSTNQVFMLGITIKNQWEGKILNVSGLNLILPAFSRLDGENCGGYEFEEKGAGEYRLKKTLGEIKDYKTLRCPIAVHNVETALGNTPISIQYFKVTTNYTYELEKSVSITIKESADEIKLREETKKSRPKFAGIADKQVNKGESFQLHLPEYASDAETPNDMLTFKVISQSRLDLVECLLDNGKTLRCTAGQQDGFSEILLEVNDGALTNTTKFRVYAGIPTPTGTTSTGATGTQTTMTADICAKLKDYIVYCEDSKLKARNADKICVSLCEYYKGCFGIQDGWGCLCTPSDCEKFGTDCVKNKCPDGVECCKDIGPHTTW
jgi:hypothetical protein